MLTKIDDRKSVVKLYWKDIRARVLSVEPVFAKLVDALDPGESFPLYLVYLPYGALKGDTKSSFLPDGKNSFYRLSSADAPKEIINDLGYGKDHSPFGMVLEKSMELFIQLKNQKAHFPFQIYRPGDFFSYGRNLIGNEQRTYAPNGICAAVSGARSAFILPNIGCATNHAKLQRDFHLRSRPAKSIGDHWHISKEIADHTSEMHNWKSCIMYFSKPWVDKINADSAWAPIKLYLYEQAWNHFAYQRNKIYYDLAFNAIQRDRNLKPNPYLVDTVKHLFAVSLGALPGYVPAVNDDLLPFECLKKVFIESYGIKKVTPAFMQPSHFHFETDKLPIYYSLNNPAIYAFSPKSRRISSALFEIRELEHLFKIFTSELSDENSTCSGTILQKIAKGIHISYYHNENDPQKIIQPSSFIFNKDPRFSSLKENVSKVDFPEDTSFFRGCISLAAKEQ